MTVSCHDFRRLLEASLCGNPAQLDWHSHLHTCEPCRRLLEGEQALDLLLAGLPQPALPADLAQRVLARLRSDPLDALLDLDQAAAAAPEGLAERVLSEARLDRWLEQAGEVRVPANLAEDVLAGLRAARRESEPIHELRPVSRAPRRFAPGPVLAAAAALVLAVGAGLWRMGSPDQPTAPQPGGAVAEAPAELDPVDEELLAQLDLLEQMELAQELDPVGLDALALLDASDELLLDWDELALDGAQEGDEPR